MGATPGVGSRVLLKSQHMKVTMPKLLSEAGVLSWTLFRLACHQLEFILEYGPGLRPSWPGPAGRASADLFFKDGPGPRWAGCYQSQSESGLARLGRAGPDRDGSDGHEFFVTAHS